MNAMVFDRYRRFVERVYESARTPGRGLSGLLAGSMLLMAPGLMGAPVPDIPAWAEVKLPSEGRVLADRVNLRARASTRGEVVGQVQYDETIQVTALEGEWLKIDAPKGMLFYVHKDFLENGKVKVGTLNVRAGSSVNYPIVGTLNRGDAVTAKGQFDVWVKIDPPPNSWLFIHSSMVQPVVPEIVAVVPEPKPPEPSPEPPPVVEERPLPRVEVIPGEVVLPRDVALPETDDGRIAEPPPGVEVVPLKGQGKLVKREGTLISYLLKGGRPSRFQLVSGRGGKQITVAYVDNSEGRLKGLVGQRVTIQGHEFWTRGETRPLLVPKSILVLEE